MRKTFKLERVTGLVALSYLVLIPVAGYVGYRKLQDLDADIEVMWSHDQALSPRIPMYKARNAIKKVLRKE